MNEKNDNSLYRNKDEWEKFLGEIAYESDRACAILGAAYLDRLLGDLIANFLIDDQEAVSSLLNPERPYAPLSFFSARISASYCLGLIDKIQYHDLNVLRRIRNQFAHSLHGLSFQDSNIIHEVKKLKTHKMALIPKDIRVEYLLTVAILSTDINIQAKEILPNRRIIPNYYGFIDDME